MRTEDRIHSGPLHFGIERDLVVVRVQVASENYVCPGINGENAVQGTAGGSRVQKANHFRLRTRGSRLPVIVDDKQGMAIDVDFHDEDLACTLCRK
ncbi:hypothetical protein H5P30_20360 [Puniceicoccus vermicola]|uniref:Uncharacterized protein n=1 Tax=Puniceicoccus vermicola TaxID=388746 RepID=A0A7X1E6E1_9BACT|nr:hypothetical protein [Puniceicoccus vermicola]MBC2604144.1 hypothetical protein [Puniceicoccus vermicola]